MADNQAEIFNNVFVECFDNLEDKRYKNKRHRFLDVIAICICGTLAGMTDFVSLNEFARAHELWFKQYILLPYGVPSHDTLNAVMSTLNPKAFNEAFIQWIGKLKSLFPENVIPIDGKTLRGSHSKNKGLKALHIVNAYSCANGLTLGQIAVDEKSNEITAIPELLKNLAISGAIITIDAIGTQKDIAKQIVDSKADYVLAVKNNQKELSDSIIDVFQLSENKNFNKNLQAEVYKHEIVGEHGRIEERVVEVLPATAISTQTDLSKWPGVQSIVRVISVEHVANTTETRYFISSIIPTQVKTIAGAIRSHWQVENNLHWTLDVVFREDDSRIRDRTTAQNMSWIRKMATYLLRQDTTKGSMKIKMIRNCINPANIIKLFARI
jgi:predicted transposase YbfD/YdcC